MSDHREWKIESIMQVLEACQSCREDSDTVITTEPRDDLLLLRSTESVVVEPDDLCIGVVGIGTTATVEDLAHSFWS
ncbi:unannotated protein [freshwater metagenome]|uniref:Unannotated protein n=1 Tax=freshwater metagenome TaxID=449393 RepID=A0A6J6E0C9_9ZZZZ